MNNNEKIKELETFFSCFDKLRYVTNMDCPREKENMIKDFYEIKKLIQDNKSLF